MAESIHDMVSSVATLLVQEYYPAMERGYQQWAKSSLKLPIETSRVWAISSFCFLPFAVASSSVHDVTASPPVKTGYPRVAPRAFTRKVGKAKRNGRGRGGRGEEEDGSSNEDSGPEWDDGGFGGSGGWGHYNNNNNNNHYGGGGGGDFSHRGDNFNEEGWRWREVGHAAFYLLFQLACCISFSHCLHFALKKLVDVVQDGVVADNTRRCSVVALSKHKVRLLLPLL